MDEITADSKLLEIFSDKPGQYEANLQATIASQNTISYYTELMHGWFIGSILIYYKGSNKF